MTDKTEFNNLRTLHAATTPGEWSARTYRGLMAAVDVEDGLIGSSMSTPDAVFIVAAHNELPALLARLDEVTAERDALAAVIEEGLNWLDDIDVYQYESDSARVSDVRNALKAAPSSVLAAHDAKVRAEALREAADAVMQEAPDEPHAGATFTAHADWLSARADKEENR